MGNWGYRCYNPYKRSYGPLLSPTYNWSGPTLQWIYELYDLYNLVHMGVILPFVEMDDISRLNSRNT